VRVRAAGPRVRAATIESAYIGAMNCKKPLSATLATAFAINCVGAGYGIQLFTDLPPLAAVITASSSFTGSALPIYATPAYNAVTDERLEAPAIEKDKVTQS
jgi:hypothetical protein